MVNVKEALEDIKVAIENEDEATLDRYAMDERVTVSKAAQKALDVIDNVEDEPTENIREKLQEEKKEPSTEGWIDMTIEESKEYRDKGLLIGYNPNNGMGLVK